jgi:hypothetical protein
MDILLARTDPPHNLNKSDLDSTLDLNKLTTRQRMAVKFPLPYHPAVRKLLMLNPLTALGSSFPVPLIDHPTKSLEAYFKEEAIPASMFSSAGNILINDFFSNTQPKREILYPLGSPLSNVVANHSVFDAVATDFEQRFFEKLQESGPEDADAVSAMLKSNGKLDAPGMPFFTIGDLLGILGSFQEIQVHLTAYRKANKYEITLLYILFDHFGCDDGDLEGLPTHGTPGQIAMWLLARDPGHAPGHKAFIVRIEVERKRWQLDNVPFRTSN